MSWWYRRVIRPLLFAQEAEAVHERTMRALSIASRNSVLRGALSLFFRAEPVPIELFGLRFPNPVGLAAGMDKYATAIPAWRALGFGFSELGGVTMHAQPGNERPRLFRAISEEAIVNRMGFNNPGAAAFAAALAGWRERGLWPQHPVGINLGKSKMTSLEKAPKDYAESFRLLRPYAEFFIVNVSSPNTPGLRKLQDRAALEEILTAIEEVQTATATAKDVRQNESRPILIKVAPDLALEAIDEILELALARGVAGIVATNTTVARPETKDPETQRVYSEAGGLSGRPLRQRSTEVIRHIYRQTRGRLPIVGVGGIFNADDAWEKITAGASLIQIYTALVYEGPSVAKSIVRGLLERMKKAGLNKLSEAVGTGT
nr:dihydroorotate dehydrogenase (quinone) [uncultured bacterium]